MLAKIQTCTLSGVDSIPVSVEIYMRECQLPGILMVGLPDLAVKESKDRIYAALATNGYKFPLHRITINLAPANLRKEGSAFDLPIAVGLLQAMGVIQKSNLHHMVIVGELSLDGQVNPICGALPIAIGARNNGCSEIILPEINAREAAVVSELKVYGVSTLKEVVEFLNGNLSIPPAEPVRFNPVESRFNHQMDMADVKGQEHAKRALEVAAAGGHNLLMIGPPGSGKTMLARRIPSILPSLTLTEALEISQIHSISGLLDPDSGLLRNKPFRAPHHSISMAGLVGGGAYPLPGEVSLGHHGVLFLDELPEFRRNVLELLRQPLEDGFVTIARAQISLTYPARFMLIAAMNPCPCGWRTHPERHCRCTPFQIERYLMKISGPLLDRIDIHLDVGPVKYRELTDERLGESTNLIRKRVENARVIQHERFGETREGVCSNAMMSPCEIQQCCKLDRESQRMMELSMERLGLSARAYHRILKLARTIADLDRSMQIRAYHLAEAIQYRSMDRSTCLQPA